MEVTDQIVNQISKLTVENMSIILENITENHELEGQWTNNTVNEYIKIVLLNNANLIDLKNITDYNSNGLYLFNIALTTELYPLLPIEYSFCYINDGNRQCIIAGYSSHIKIFYLNDDINVLLNNLTTKNLSALFRPQFDEQYLFDNVIKVNSVDCKYISQSDLNKNNLQ